MYLIDNDSKFVRIGTADRLSILMLFESSIRSVRDGILRIASSGKSSKPTLVRFNCWSFSRPVRVFFDNVVIYKNESSVMKILQFH